MNGDKAPRRRPNRENSDPVLVTAVDDLFTAAARAKWPNGRPVIERGARGAVRVSAIRELWRFQDGEFSDWRKFDTVANSPNKLLETEARILSVLKGDAYEDLVAKDGLDPDDELSALARARAILEHWRSDACREMLDWTIGRLEQVHAERQRALAPSPLKATGEGTPVLIPNLEGRGVVLELERNDVSYGVEARRNLFLRRPTWALINNNAYANRPQTLEGAYKRFEQFLATQEDAARELRLPLFWIGGRSGDGKSVLLLQLCRKAIDEATDRTFVLFNTPDDLIDWLEACLSDKAAALCADPGIIAVVDDLHKALNWERTLGTLEYAATAGLDLAIVTCGPTPERMLFLRETETFLKTTNQKTGPFDINDRQALEEHLQIDLGRTNAASPNLVEQLFLGLSSDRPVSIEAFARSLKARIDDRVEQENLLEELTAMTWMDLPIPETLVGPVEVEWLNQLADETQLHCEAGPNGFRFGHPAIARPIFDALTRRRDMVESVTVRVARTLSRILPRLEIAACARALRQITTRLSAEGGEDIADVLQILFDNSKGSNLAAAVAVHITLNLRETKKPVSVKWRNIARSYCSNITIDESTRAHLATNLAFCLPFKRQDFDRALAFVDDASMAPYMSHFLLALLLRANQTIPNAYFIGPAVRWIESQKLNRNRQHVLVRFIRRNPADTRIREAARKVLVDTHIDEISTALMESVAKYFEEDNTTIIERWLATNGQELHCANVFAALLAKPNSPWLDAALAWIGPDPRLESAWIEGLCSILAQIEHDHPFVQKAVTWAECLIDEQAASQLFTVLAQRAKDFGTSSLVLKRIENRWSATFDLSGNYEALKTFEHAWVSLAGDHDEMARKFDELCDLIGALKESKANGGPNQQVSDTRKLEKKLNAATHTVGAIVNRGRHREKYARSALRHLKRWPKSGLAGRISGQLLIYLYRNAGSGDDAGSLVRSEEAFIREVAWECADNTTDPQPQNAISALNGLMLMYWDTEADRIREKIKDLFFPRPKFGADRVLFQWLSMAQCRDEAMSFLLDDSIHEQARLRTRGWVAAKSLDFVFEALRGGDLTSAQQDELLKLLQIGIGDHERNKAAAWAAWSRHDQWPPVAVRALWRGILQSCLYGFTVRRDDIWPSFSAWHAVHRDAVCQGYLDEFGLSIVGPATERHVDA